MGKEGQTFAEQIGEAYENVVETVKEYINEKPNDEKVQDIKDATKETCDEVKDSMSDLKDEASKKVDNLNEEQSEGKTMT